ncbi:unnamed protein product [Protopolystoma xenopodis]|uniref:Uncharacterized protein n=1 Tax=Protopolystoma xenopodis TaxID=117903 RepID=A0A448X8H0_9PLAT|nr:unnamed protein product [Protopolystoma xenopodis]
MVTASIDDVQTAKYYTPGTSPTSLIIIGLASCTIYKLDAYAVGIAGISNLAVSILGETSKGVI